MAFNLTLGDIFDINNALVKIADSHKIVSPVNQPPSHNILHEPREGTTAEGPIDNENASNSTNPSHTISPSAPSNDVQPLEVNTDGILSNSEDSGDDTDKSEGIKSDDETFKGFANRNEVREMSQLERLANKNKISNYHRLVQLDMHPSKPVIVTGCSSKGSKRNLSDSGQDSTPRKPKPKKQHRSRKDESSPSRSRKDSKSHSKKDDKSHKRQSKLKDKPKQAIEEDLRAYQSSDLSKTEQALITAFLENPLNRQFSIPALLEVNDDDSLDGIVAILKSNGTVFGKNLSKLLDYLVNYLYEMASDPSNVTAELREALAVSLVACYPKLGQSIGEHSVNLPWSWLYNRKQNIGKLANIVAHRQTKQKSRLRGGGTREKRKPPTAKETEIIPKLSAVHDMQLSTEARFLKALLGVDASRGDIELAMRKTFKERRQLIASQQYTNSAIIEAWHHLKSFRGEMIDLEFELLHPKESKNLIKNYHNLVLPLLKLAEDKEKYPSAQFYSDVTLQTMIVLSQFLPKPKKCYPYEKSMNPAPDIKDFLQIVPVGSNVQFEINEKRRLSKHPIQPYLLGIGTEKKIESIILVLGDSQSVQLPPAIQILKAVDLLVKAHYVLDTHYVLGWKNVFRFLELHVYKLEISGERLATFTEQYLQLINL